ncbi:MAG: erythromycin biosynthesis sensory transduction protein eryC1, partial [Alphaproteobacteria bacterium]|nr:erythromycin biosynthesis sensory transduction protein eryC1 [Alphaproteobacteria bacterium]
RNSRLDEIQAALLRVKLPHLDRWNARRRSIAARYSTGLNHLPITLPVTADAAGNPSYVGHLYVIRTANRDALASALKSQGIGTDIHYPVPDHRQATCPRAAANVQLPVTEALASEVLTLPCYPEIPDSEVDAVIAAVRTWAAATHPVGS